MITNLEKAVYASLKNNLKFYKSARYRKRFKEKYPDPIHGHHPFGSFVGKKTSDYTMIPLTREQHERAHKEMDKVAMENLHVMINLMQEYIYELEQELERNSQQKCCD